jgi:branched-chain amino acid transport system substrate-binding protein
MKRRTLMRSAGAAALVSMPGIALRAWGAQGSTIKVGQSAVLSGPVGTQTQAIKRGASLVFDGVNRVGGIGGLPIELISLDDEFQPAKTVANCERLLLSDHVVALFGMVGSANLVAAQPLLEQTGVPVVGAIAVSDSARQKTRGSTYYVRAGYGREVSKIAQQLATIGAQRIALACIANPGGEEVRTALLQKLQELGVKPGATVSVNPDGSNIAACAATLAADRPQAVVLFIPGTLPAKVIEALDALRVYPTYYGMSAVSGETTAKALGSKLRQLVIAQILPYPWSNDSAPVQAFRRVADQAAVPVDYASFEGYINAQVLVEVLKRAGKDLSPAKLHAILKRLKGRFGGMDVDFTGDTNTGSTLVELVSVSATGKFTR